MALQNTNVDGARAVVRSLRKILLNAEFGLATREPDDGAASLL